MDQLLSLIESGYRHISWYATTSPRCLLRSASWRWCWWGPHRRSWTCCFGDCVWRVKIFNWMLFSQNEKNKQTTSYLKWQLKRRSPGALRTTYTEQYGLFLWLTKLLVVSTILQMSQWKHALCQFWRGGGRWQFNCNFTCWQSTKGKHVQDLYLWGCLALDHWIHEQYNFAFLVY